ncbi:MAG: hypothetical protein ACLSVG_07550 [Clostridia bacterium]
MSNIILSKSLESEEKLTLMQEDAKYEIGSDRDAEHTAITCAAEITGRTAPPKIPKLFLASNCIFNCAYCGCRCSREERQNYRNTPEELARMAVASAQENHYGVFLSSAIFRNPDYTQELLAESARIMREDLGYNGFLHVKVMPGADPELIARTGRYASRLSINIEVAHSTGYDKIAKQKNKENILKPMGQISQQIRQAKEEGRCFAVSQTTQLMAGSTDENDRAIMTLSAALYRKYRLKRVYYTPFRYQHPARGYESENLAFKQTPYWRMARLYQADRLIQLYGFSPDDVTPETDPFLHRDLDPKAAWALRHIDLYPVEVNRADYETLLRVPGIGITYAKRILEARRYSTITHDLLRKMKVSLKRCIYFITCDGKYKGGALLGSTALRHVLTSGENSLSISHSLTADETKP